MPVPFTPPCVDHCLHRGCILHSVEPPPPPRRRVHAPDRPATMSSARRNAFCGGPSHQRRGFNRLTTETAVLLDNVRLFFVGERAAGRSHSLDNPVARTARATGVSERSVQSVRDDDFFESLADTGERERRVRGWRTSPTRVRACVTR